MVMQRSFIDLSQSPAERGLAAVLQREQTLRPPLKRPQHWTLSKGATSVKQSAKSKAAGRDNSFRQSALAAMESSLAGLKGLKNRSRCNRYRARNTPAGLVYHVLNRGVGRQTLFRKEEDYAAFERVMAEAHQQVPLRILAYCLMPNHWHFIMSPKIEGEMSEFMKWMTHTHTPAMACPLPHGWDRAFVSGSVQEFSGSK